MKKNPPAYTIESIICLAHRFESIANKYVFQPMNFSPVSMKILKALSLQPGLSPKDLLEITSSTKSNISQRLDHLEKKGFIKRGSAPRKDRRKITLDLTSSGRKKLQEIEKRFERAHISFAENLESKELEEHRRFFKKLNLILDSSEDQLEKLFKI